MRAIFISYRRDDAEGQAGRLFKDLVAHFGPDAVFMDVAGIAAGADFRTVIEQHVASCGVLLSLIGKEWLAATDESGKRRLEDSTDFVRLETASALKRNIPVIPVLVQGARMPRPQQLPRDLEALAYRNAVELTHARWDSDLRLLMEALAPHVGERSSARRGSSAARTVKWIAAAGIAALALTALYEWQAAGPAPDDAVAAAVESPAAETPFAGPQSVPESLTSGRMLLYEHSGYRDGSPDWPITAQQIGAGWNVEHVFAGDGGAIYAVRDDGKVLFYKHRGAEWQVRDAEVGSGWSFKQVFAGDDGLAYAITL